MKKTVTAIVILWVMGFLCPGIALTEEPAKTSVTVMSYNIYRGGTMRGQPLSQTAKVIQEAKADIVGVQETRSPSGVNAEKLAQLLGWNYYEDRGNRVIITRYEIVEELRDGIKVRLPSGQEAYLFNLHLPSHPYQPYQLLEIRPKWHKHTNNIEFIKTEAEAIEWAEKARGGDITALLEQINKLPDQDAPVFVVGDFNEPSHLDWTENAAASGRHPIKVAYPASNEMAQAGFADAWRTLYPDEMEQPGYTWSPAYPFDDPTTHPDRIDFVYFRGKDVSLKEAKIVGENKENAHVVVSPYPSDHRAVVGTFSLPNQTKPNPATEQAAFEKAEADTAWAEVFSDPGTADWQEQWFLDGEVGTVTNNPEGMTLMAGPEFKNDAHHMVLWTKDSFSGDLKIEYDYTRLDEAPNCVTILYVQATGSGKGPYAKDITKWSELRKVPAMKMYFNHMNTYHISYAAFPESKKAYLRGRRYLPENEGLKGTELKPDYSTPTLFATGVKHHITVIKKDRDLHVRVENPDEVVYCHMNNPDLPAITEGRIGLRHMFTRSARYANLRVSQPASRGEAVTIGLIGDSTVAEQSGWGPAFAERFDRRATILNYAKNGATLESLSAKLDELVQHQPDYVLLQFGHNDQKRYDTTVYSDHLKSYVERIQQAGGQPVIVSSVTRRSFDADGKIVSNLVQNEKYSYRATLTDYAQAAEAVAKEWNLPFIDLHRISIAHHNQIGPEASMTYNFKEGDKTHFNRKGAEAITDLIVEELKTVLPDVASYVKTARPAE